MTTSDHPLCSAKVLNSSEDAHLMPRRVNSGGILKTMAIATPRPIKPSALIFHAAFFLNTADNVSNSNGKGRKISRYPGLARKR